MMIKPCQLEEYKPYKKYKYKPYSKLPLDQGCICFTESFLVDPIISFFHSLLSFFKM